MTKKDFGAACRAKRVSTVTSAFTAITADDPALFLDYCDLLEEHHIVHDDIYKHLMTMTNAGNKIVQCSACASLRQYRENSKEICSAMQNLLADEKFLVRKCAVTTLLYFDDQRASSLAVLRHHLEKVKEHPDLLAWIAACMDARIQEERHLKKYAEKLLAAR